MEIVIPFPLGSENENNVLLWLSSFPKQQSIHALFIINAITHITKSFHYDRNYTAKFETVFV